MSLTQFRREFDMWWRETSARRSAEKDSQAALFDLFDLYRGLSAEERGILDRVFCEWLESTDEVQLFDAIAMIDEFAIRACLPELLRYQRRLEFDDSASAPYELAKVKRVIERIG